MLDISREVLRYQYFDKKMSLDELCFYYETSKKQLQKLFRKYGFKARSKTWRLRRVINHETI